MAGPTQLDTGQLLTYLYLYTLPYIIHYLIKNALPSYPAEIKQTIWVFSQVPPWPPRGHRGHMSRYKYRQKVQPCWRGRVKWKAMLWAHLFALAIAYFRVGCCVESHLHCIFGAPLCLTAFMSSAGNPDQVRFYSDSFSVPVGNHASYCMANSPHLFETLVLSEVGNVDGINDGLEIAGKGTFKFKIADNDGRTHIIHVPNSLYLSKLKSCLLSPQHWVQEAGDRQTWMVNGAHHCILQWADGRKTMPFNKSSNTPIFYTPSSCHAFQAFAGRFEAMEASFFQRETVIRISSHRLLREDAGC
jgi:hypothetical protein